MVVLVGGHLTNQPGNRIRTFQRYVTMESKTDTNIQAIILISMYVTYKQSYTMVRI